MTLGPFLRDLADRLDADSAEGQEETIHMATDYLKGTLRAVRTYADRFTADKAQEG